jgi:hypothetical protein
MRRSTVRSGVDRAGKRLVEEEIALRRPACRCHGRGSVRQVEVNEDGADDGRIGEKGEDPHLPATARAQERQDLVDVSEKLGPAASIVRAIRSTSRRRAINSVLKSGTSRSSRNRGERAIQ